MTTQRRRTRDASVQVRTISNEENFRNANLGRKRSTQESVELGDGEANIDYSGPDRVLMWKPVLNDNLEIRDFVPRAVPSTRILLNQAEGWRSTCPFCNTNHEGSPLPPSDPNSCPAKGKVAVMLCPVCSVRITDERETVMRDPIMVDGEQVLEADFSGLTTPQERLQQKLRIHLWMRHPQRAEMMGIPELQGSYREAVQAMRPN